MRPAPATRSDYSIEEVADLLRLPRAEVQRCLKAGVLSTPWQPGGKARLNFQDLVLLRSVASLSSARIAPHRVRRALQRLKARLPESSPLSGLQVIAGGNQLVVRQGEHVWDAESFQLLLDLQSAPGAERDPPDALPLRAASSPTAQAARQPTDAEVWYQRGCEWEDTDAPRAVHAYREALTRDPKHEAARINLGRLHHQSGALELAEACFREALERNPEDAILGFNLGVTLEDRGQEDEAMTLYARALFLDPHFADAHFNLARLHERRGDRLAALRHLSAYRNLTPA